MNNAIRLNILHLSRNAAQVIEDYLVKKNEEAGWFDETPADPAATPAPAVIAENPVIAAE